MKGGQAWDILERPVWRASEIQTGLGVGGILQASNMGAWQVYKSIIPLHRVENVWILNQEVSK
jgi:hypothetical protein